MCDGKNAYLYVAIFILILRIVYGRPWEIRCTDTAAHIYFSEEIFNFLGRGRLSKRRGLGRRGNNADGRGRAQSNEISWCTARLDYHQRRRGLSGTMQWRDCPIPKIQHADETTGRLATYSVAHFVSPWGSLVDVVCKCHSGITDGKPALSCEGKMIFPNSTNDTATASESNHIAASLNAAELFDMAQLTGIPHAKGKSNQIFHEVVTQAEAMMSSLARVDLLDVIYEKVKERNSETDVSFDLLGARLLFQTQIVGRPNQFVFPRECTLQLSRNSTFHVYVIKDGCETSDIWALRIDGHDRSKTRHVNVGEGSITRQLRVNRLLFSFSLSGLIGSITELENPAALVESISSLSAHCALDVYQGVPRLERICSPPERVLRTLDSKVAIADDEDVNKKSFDDNSKDRGLRFNGHGFNRHEINEREEVERILRTLKNFSEMRPRESRAKNARNESKKQSSTVNTDDDISLMVAGTPQVDDGSDLATPTSRAKSRNNYPGQNPKRKIGRRWEDSRSLQQKRPCMAERVLADRQVPGCRFAAVVQCRKASRSKDRTQQQGEVDRDTTILRNTITRILEKELQHRGHHEDETSSSYDPSSIKKKSYNGAKPPLLLTEGPSAVGGSETEQQAIAVVPRRNLQDDAQKFFGESVKASPPRLLIVDAFGSRLKGWSELKLDKPSTTTLAPPPPKKLPPPAAPPTRSPKAAEQIKFEFQDYLLPPDMDAILAQKELLWGSEEGVTTTKTVEQTAAAAAAATAGGIAGRLPGPPRRPNRGILGLGIGRDVPNSRASIYRAVNLVSYGPWMVEWGRDRIERSTQVQVGNDIGFVSDSVGVVQKETAFSTGWKRMITTVSYNEVRQELGLGVAVGPYGVNVDRSQVLRATAVEVLARGVEAGTLLDFTDRNFGQRLKVRNFEISIRHDFDDYLLASDIGFGTEVLVGFRGFSTAAVIDVREQRIGVTVGLRNYNFAVLHDFDSFLTEAQANWGRGWQLALEADFPDEFSTTTFLGMGFGRISRVFTQIGAGVGEEGLPQASAKLQTRNVGLGIDLLEEFGQRLFQFALTVGKFTYVWQCNFIPENVLVPNIFGVPPERLREFFLSLLPTAPPPIL